MIDNLSLSLTFCTACYTYRYTFLALPFLKRYIHVTKLSTSADQGRNSCVFMLVICNENFMKTSPDDTSQLEPRAFRDELWTC